MGRTVAELKATLTMDELAHWYAFDQRSPIGDSRLSFLFAHLCMTLCSAHGVTKRGGAAFAVEDFLVFDRPEKPMTTAREAMQQWFGGIVRKKPKKVKRR